MTNHDPICPACKEPCEANEVDKSVCCGARLWGPEFRAAQKEDRQAALELDQEWNSLRRLVKASERVIEENGSESSLKLLAGVVRGIKG